MIVSSLGAVQAMTRTRGARWYGESGGSVPLYGSGAATYFQIFKSQPNVRTVVEFLARNIASLGIHWFRRISDTDRQRLDDHPVALTFDHPNPGRTCYRLIEELVTDMGIYFNAFWLKLPAPEPQRLSLLRLPPCEVEVEGGLLPTAYYWTTPNGERKPYPPEAIVHFSGPFGGISPLETLRRVIAEEASAVDYRAGLWRNGARIDGVLTRQKDTPAAKWSPDQVEQFREKWQEFSSTGTVAGKAGKTAILPVGMDFKPATFSARDSEFIAGGKLRREVCAAAYHIPLPMVGILDHATFSNIREQHKQLYADCLGPSLVMYAQEFMRQVLPEYDDIDRVYCEFNIAEKLKGDFEEQAGAIQTLVGRPVMTLNEGRARLNLGSKTEPDADTVAMPLNMGGGAAAPPVDPNAPPPDPGTAQASAFTVVHQCWARQWARLSKVPPAARAQAFDDARWNRELAADLAPIYRALGYDGETTARLSRESAMRVNAWTRARLEAGHASYAAPPAGILRLEA